MAETTFIIKGGGEELDLFHKAEKYYNSVTPKWYELKDNDTFEMTLRHPEKSNGFSIEDKKEYEIEDILKTLEKHRQRQYNKQKDYSNSQYKDEFWSAYTYYIAEKKLKIILSEKQDVKSMEKLSFKDKYITPLTKEYKHFIHEMENTPSEIFYRDGERRFTEQERKFMQIYEQKQPKISPNSIRQENSQMIGGTIREIAGKSLSDKNYLYLFDEETKNTIDAYLKTKPNLEPIELDSKDYLAISNVFEKEKNLGIELSSEKREKIVSLYYELYQAKEKQELNQQNMETQQPAQEPTQSKKFDVAEYLNNQMKYLGFGDNYKETIQQHLDKAEKGFQIKTTSDRVMEGNQVDFAVNFNKSEKGGVFLNSFDARLITQDGEERSHNFKLNFTAKEAINLLEGRAVKTEFTNSNTNEPFESFVKLKFNEPKNEYDNYKLEFHKANEIDTAKIVELSGLKFEKPEYKDFVVKSLEKGNITNVKFTHEGNEIEGKAVLNPQYKNLNLYDKDMNRLNTNKPLQGLEQDNSHEKNNVRQQNISRSI